MLGKLIESLDDPKVALGLIATLDDSTLSERLAVAAKSAGRPQSDIVAATVRGFLESASDDHWLQLIGVMNRAEDPGLAAMRAILAKALPELVP
ncbi:MAG: hypothetical protein ACYC5H_11040 [Methylovirgula sp.]